MAPSKKNLQIGALGFDQQAEKLSLLPKQQINRQDIFGRTLLHLAASTGNAQLVDAILDNPHVDANAVDLESGWTALHRALAYGNISAARLLYNRESAEIQDRSKATALDVLTSTIDISLDEFNGKGTELFTFGSNANHTLGFADPDDRSHPAWVKLARETVPTLTPRDNFKPVKIASAAISKLHSAVIVDGSLLTAGISRGGRLGTGAQSTQFEFTKVPIEDETIIDVALGLDHSVAVTSGGSVYTWGSNKSAQLGYASDGLQIAPRKVLTSNEMRRADITRCSASRIHTIAFNSHEIYIWGTNIGQMGFISTPDVSVGSVIAEGGGITEPNPRLLSMSHEIVDAIATDVATIVLLDNGDVRVYMKGGSFRVALPETSSLRGGFDVFRSRSASIPIRVEMISASSNGTVSMLTNLGSVLQFQLERFASSEESVGQIGKQLRVNEMWKPRSRQMRARHVACADDGSIVVCVANGSVWKRRKTKRGTTVERLPLVNRIQRVVCDANFASFMAIREDLKLEPVCVTGSELADDLEFCLPFVNSGDSRKHDEMLLSEPTQKRIANLYFEDSHEFEDDDEGDTSNKVDPGVVQFVSSMTEESLMMRLEMAVHGRETMTWRLKGIEMPVNRYIFEARVPDFADCDLAKLQGGSLQFDESVRVETLVVLCYYLYTDRVIPAWDASSRSYARDKLEGAREQVLELASRWKLDRLRTSIIRMVPAVPSLSTLTLSTGHDVTILLKDGKAKAHKFMLQTRSAFFESVFSPRWDTAGDLNVVDLSHISKDVFNVVLKHIYKDTDNQAFDASNVPSLKTFVRLVIDTMATADELSMLRLREVCESILCSLVTVKNCGDFLKEAVKSHAHQLRDRMLYYIAHNLECILENNFLIDLDEDLMQMIDNYMKLAQQSRLQLDDSTFWRALNEPVYHNELFSRDVPVYGASVANNLLLRERKRRQSSFANERPDFKEEKQKSAKEPAEPVVSPARVSPPSKTVKTPVKAPPPPPPTSTPASIGQQRAMPIRKSPATSLPAATPPHVEPVKIGDLFRTATATNSSNEPSKPIVIATPKMSQKERKKMRQQSFSSASNNSPPVSQSLPSSSPSSKIWATPPKSAFDPADSPFAALKQRKHSAPPPERTTLKDIIQQEQRTVQQKQVQAQRSFKEIQEEEEFEKWWAEESAKYQAGSNTNNAAASKGEHSSSPRSSKSGKRGRGGGSNAPRGGRRQSGNGNAPHAEAQRI